MAKPLPLWVSWGTLVGPVLGCLCWDRGVGGGGGAGSNYCGVVRVLPVGSSRLGMRKRGGGIRRGCPKPVWVSVKADQVYGFPSKGALPLHHVLLTPQW